MIDALPKITISFIVKYVDDILLGCNPKDMDNIALILKSTLPNMPIDFVFENSSGLINYLDVTLLRKGQNISSWWYGKPYASEYKEMLRKGLSVTSPDKRKVTLKRL